MTSLLPLQTPSALEGRLFFNCKLIQGTCPAIWGWKIFTDNSASIRLTLPGWIMLHLILATRICRPLGSMACHTLATPLPMPTPSKQYSSRIKEHWEYLSSYKANFWAELGITGKYHYSWTLAVAISRLEWILLFTHTGQALHSTKRNYSTRSSILIVLSPITLLHSVIILPQVLSPILYNHQRQRWTLISRIHLSLIPPILWNWR